VVHSSTRCYGAHGDRRTGSRDGTPWARARSVPRIARARRDLGLFAVSLGLLVVGCGSAAMTNPASPVKTDGVPVATVWAGHPVEFDLLTHGQHQFVAFYDAERQMTVASRTLGTPAWSFKRLPSRVSWDSHNYVTMAIDDESHLHVAGNMHVSPLTYFRTQRPLDIRSLEQVGAMVGSAEDQMTYPRFLRGPDNEFLFTYRHGRSGNGDVYVNVYDHATRTWRRLFDSPLLAGEGMRNAYPVGPSRGPDGLHHLAWVWRETPPDARTNHTVSYARSRDLRVWETSTGDVIELPITLGNGDVVDPVPPGGGTINGNVHIGFDGDRRPVVSYQKYDAGGYTQVFNARPEGGRWRIHQTSAWTDRWDISGGGSLAFRLRFRPVELTPAKELTQIYWHWNQGAGRWHLDPRTLRPVREERLRGQGPLARLCETRSGIPGAEVKLRAGQGAPTTGVRYVLRWETLPVHRDQPRTFRVPPSELRVHEVPAVGELLGCVYTGDPRGPHVH
jgi:hypothetical protein